MLYSSEYDSFVSPSAIKNDTKLYIACIDSEIQLLTLSLNGEYQYITVVIMYDTNTHPRYFINVTTDAVHPKTRYEKS